MKLEISGRMDDLFVVRVRHDDARTLATFRLNADGTTALTFADDDLIAEPLEAGDDFARIAEALRIIVAKCIPDATAQPQQGTDTDASGETVERARRKRRTKAEMEAARASDTTEAAEGAAPEETNETKETTVWEDDEVAPEPVAAVPAPPRRREAATDEGPDVAHVTGAPATVRRRRPIIDRSGGLV